MFFSDSNTTPITHYFYYIIKVKLVKSVVTPSICSTTLFQGFSLFILLYEIFIRGLKLKTCCCYLTEIIHGVKLEHFLWYLTVKQYLSLNHIQVIPSWWCGDFAVMHSCIKKNYFTSPVCSWPLCSNKSTSQAIVRLQSPTELEWIPNERGERVFCCIETGPSASLLLNQHVWGARKRVFGPIIFLVELFQERPSTEFLS